MVELAVSGYLKCRLLICVKWFEERWLSAVRRLATAGDLLRSGVRV